MKTNIWSSNGNVEELLNLSDDEKRAYLSRLYGDADMFSNMTADELDNAVTDNISSVNDAIDEFRYDIAPHIASQVRDGMVLDENFNLVFVEDLLDSMNGPSAEIYLDDGVLYFDVEGRKAFPILGFSEDDSVCVEQLNNLGILDTLRSLYPGKEDVDFADRYYYGDMIPFDWALLEDVLTKPTDEGLNEDCNDEINEASTKDPKGLARELKDLKKYPGEHFTEMPFTAYDNDELSIEYQYPNFFKVVKAFFKEMELLDDRTKEDYIKDRYPHGNPDISLNDVTLKDPDVLDFLWELEDQLSISNPSDFRHDWNVLIDTCERLALKPGSTVQIEKIYKTGYNSPLSDEEIIASREQDESLKEDFNTNDLYLLEVGYGDDEWDAGQDDFLGKFDTLVRYCNNIGRYFYPKQVEKFKSGEINRLFDTDEMSYIEKYDASDASQNKATNLELPENQFYFINDEDELRDATLQAYRDNDPNFGHMFWHFSSKFLTSTDERNQFRNEIRRIARDKKARGEKYFNVQGMVSDGVNESLKEDVYRYDISNSPDIIEYEDKDGTTHLASYKTIDKNIPYSQLYDWGSDVESKFGNELRKLNGDDPIGTVLGESLNEDFTDIKYFRLSELNSMIDKVVVFNKNIIYSNLNEYDSEDEKPDFDRLGFEIKKDGNVVIPKGYTAVIKGVSSAEGYNPELYLESNGEGFEIALGWVEFGEMSIINPSVEESLDESTPISEMDTKYFDSTPESKDPLQRILDKRFSESGIDGTGIHILGYESDLDYIKDVLKDFFGVSEDKITIDDHGTFYYVCIEDNAEINRLRSKAPELLAEWEKWSDYRDRYAELHPELGLNANSAAKKAYEKGEPLEDTKESFESNIKTILKEAASEFEFPDEYKTDNKFEYNIPDSKIKEISNVFYREFSDEDFEMFNDNAIDAYMGNPQSKEVCIKLMDKYNLPHWSLTAFVNAFDED